MVLQLPHSETDRSRVYSMPDPDELFAAYDVVARWAHFGERRPTGSEFVQVLMLARGYLDLTTYTLGREHCVRKLRDIWRARREVR